MNVNRFLILAFLGISQLVIGQSPGFVLSKEFSKDITLYKAKAFLMQEIFDSTDNLVLFEVDALAASSSGELTSLAYVCKSNKKEGLLLGFYGNFWNDQGVIYQGYGFKNLTKETTIELLNKISKTIEENQLSMTNNNNINVFFWYNDLTILISYFAQIKIRVFWNDFDAEWEYTAFTRTKKRFERGLN